MSGVTFCLVLGAIPSSVHGLLQSLYSGIILLGLLWTIYGDRDPNCVSKCLTHCTISPASDIMF